MANSKNKKKAKQAAKKHPLLVAVLLVLVVVIVIAAVAIYFYKPEVYHKYLGVGDHYWSQWETVTKETCGDAGLRSRACAVCGEAEEEVVAATGNHSYGEDGICTVCGDDKNFSGAQGDAESADFSIHVIDLGKNAGDSIYIKAGDNDILIDAGSQQGSATLICEYLSNYVTDGKLEYVIMTHADQDHIAAFYGNSGSGGKRTGVLYQYEVDTVIKFAQTGKSTAIYNNVMSKVDELEKSGTQVYTASQCYDETDGARRQYWLDSEHTLSMNILYNYYYYNQSSDENNHSVVTLFTKTTDAGNFNYLFTGDLEQDGESRLVDYYSTASNSKSEYDILPEVEFYKAGHHGSGTSSTDKLLSVIKPKYIAISCCAGSPEYTLNNANTFPYQASFDNMLKYTDKIYCTSVATDLPALNDGQFASKSWNYEAYNGNIVLYFNSRTDEDGKSAGGTKLWCSNSFDTILESDWFKQYRTV